MAFFKILQFIFVLIIHDLIELYIKIRRYMSIYIARRVDNEPKMGDSIYARISAEPPFGFIGSVYKVSKKTNFPVPTKKYKIATYTKYDSRYNTNVTGVNIIEVK